MMAQPRALEEAASALVRSAKTRGGTVEPNALLEVVLLYAPCGYSSRQILSVVRSKARRAQVELAEPAPVDRERIFLAD
jgi:hypothetical protein